MLRIDRTRPIAVLAVLMSLAASGAFAAGPLVDFEDFEAGDDVTGAGTAHPSLVITPVPVADLAQAIVTGKPPPGTFGAPNCDFGPGCKDALDGSFTNNCLEDADGNRVDLNDSPDATAVGFANLTANTSARKHEFDFTFVDNVTVSSFSIRVFDLGDFNPQRATQHGISLTAKDGAGNVLDTDAFTFTSNAAVNPTSGSAGNLFQTGDACDANGPNSGEPGYLELSVSAPAGASRVELRQTGGPDPNVGFDSINFSACTRTIGYWKNHPWGDLVADINGDEIMETEGRSSPVDEKPGNGYLWQATGRNFSMLFAQLIAAKLNCDGSKDCSSDGSITAAEDFLLVEGIFEGSFDMDFSSKSQKREAAKLSSALDSFNNGFECADPEDNP